MNNQELDPLYEKYKNLSPASQQRVFHDCCKNGDLESVEFFLTSPKLYRNVNIHHDSDLAFRNACTWGRYDIIKYFILEYGIKKTNEITLYLQIQSEFRSKQVKLPVKDCADEAIELFKKRALHRQLSEDLFSINSFQNNDWNQILSGKPAPNKKVTKRTKI